MDDEVRVIRASASAGAAPAGPATSDRIEWLRTSLVFLPLVEQARTRLASHCAMKIHVHLAAAHPHEPWVEQFE